MMSERLFGMVRMGVLGTSVLAVGCEAAPGDSVSGPASDPPPVQTQRQERPGLRVGSVAPNFQLRDLNGTPIDLTKITTPIYILSSLLAVWLIYGIFRSGRL